MQRRNASPFTDCPSITYREPERRVVAEDFDLDARAAIMDRFRELGGTLDGEKAVIYGRKLRFPIVEATSRRSAEWSWPALQRAVDTGNVALKTR